MLVPAKHDKQYEKYKALQQQKIAINQVALDKGLSGDIEQAKKIASSNSSNTQQSGKK